MLLKSIYLYNFRTFKDKKFEFNELNNLIVALNGLGKSNLIEAINFFSTAKSFKTNINKEVISFNEEKTSIIAEIINNKRESKIIIAFKEDGTKKITINNSVLKKTSELLSEFTTILISPNDVSIIDGSPSIRRKYLDNILSKVNKDYLEKLKQYKRIIEIKRKILKDNNLNEKLLMIYQSKLEEINYQITRERKKLIQLIEEISNNYLNNYYSSVGKISLNYIDSFQNNSIFKEKKYKECLYGAHRDEFEINLNIKSVKKYCSTGEKRLISLILKISEKIMFNQKLKIKPVLLLDDAFLGLDDERKNIFYELLESDHQKILTSTEETCFNKLKETKVLRL